MIKQLRQLREARRKRQKKIEAAMKMDRYLVDCKSDISFLQKVIALVNKDPDLRVQMVLNDGTHLNIWSQQEAHHNLWTGEEYDLV